MVRCASLTRTCVAPASTAPSIAAFTSSVSNCRPISYSTPGARTCSQSTIPAVPSMSLEMNTFTAAHPAREPRELTREHQLEHGLGVLLRGDVENELAVARSQRHVQERAAFALGGDQLSQSLGHVAFAAKPQPDATGD